MQTQRVISDRKWRPARQVAAALLGLTLTGCQHLHSYRGVLCRVDGAKIFLRRDGTYVQDYKETIGSGDSNGPSETIQTQTRLWRLVFPDDGPPGPGFPGEGSPDGRVYVRVEDVHDGEWPFDLIPADSIPDLNTLLTPAQVLSIKAAETLGAWNGAAGDAVRGQKP